MTKTSTPRAKTTASRIKDVIFGNLTAKIMALVMALTLWFYAYKASRQEDMWTLPVEISVTEGWALSEEEPKVQITVAYTETLREEFKSARAAGRIRLTAALTPDDQGASEQAFEIKLRQSNLRTPAGIKVVLRDVNPSRIEVTVVREEKQTLPVTVKISDPPAGFMLAYTPRPIPNKVEVRGSRDVLSQATTIETELLDISGLTPLRGMTEEQKLPVRIVQYVMIGDEERPVVCDQEIQVQVALIPEPATKTFENIPIHLLIPYDYPYEAELREQERAVNVTVSGPASVVDKLNPENIALYVDVSDVENLKPQELRYTEPIRVHVVDTPQSSDLTVRLSLNTCSIKISALDAE